MLEVIPALLLMAMEYWKEVNHRSHLLQSAQIKNFSADINHYANHLQYYRHRILTIMSLALVMAFPSTAQPLDAIRYLII